MTDGQRQRWQQLQAFEFDPPGATIQFETKLYWTTGWTSDFAARAIEEYRRFLLLAAITGHKVSPSPIVDQVWHLHLLYTRNYWEELCPKVLGFDLHHEPATGMAGNTEELEVAYDRTLASYEAAFGHAPPADIWLARPKPSLYQMVDVSRFVVIQQARWRTLMYVAVVASLFIMIAMLGFLYLMGRR